MDLISELEPYILNEKNMSIYLKYKFNGDFINDTNNNNIVKQQSKINQLFIPPEEDSLFWCYYIIKNGDIKYEMLNNKNTLVAKQLKIDYIKIIRDNKLFVKSYKFDTISNIESNLANDNNVNIKSIMTLCAIEKFNLIFINKNTYFELLMNDSNNIYIINEIQPNTKYNKKYGFELASVETLNEIRNSLYKLESIDKPIKSLSFYKVKDLLNIANKLEIEIINKQTGKNKTKNELYESIIQHF